MPAEASDAEAAKSFHYRSWMMNMVVDFGQTFGETLSEEKAAGLLDKYLRTPPENPDEPWGRWRRDAQAAAEALRSGEMSRRPAVMVVVGREQSFRHSGDGGSDPLA